MMKRRMSDQQKILSSASRVGQAHKDDYVLFGNVFMQRDLLLEIIHALNFVNMLTYDMM